MIIKKSIHILYLMLGLVVSVIAQETNINLNLFEKLWSAQWIKVDGAHSNEYGVYHFRKKISRVRRSVISVWCSA